MNLAVDHFYFFKVSKKEIISSIPSLKKRGINREIIF